MGVDIVEVAGVNLRVMHGYSHRARDLSSFGMRLRHMMRVRRASVADEFTVDWRRAAPGMFELFEDEHSPTLAHDEPVAVLIEWPAGLLRFVIPQAQGLHGREPGNAERSNGCLTASPRKMSASPNLIVRQASPTELAPVAQAVTMQILGPRRPNSWETFALAALPIIPVMANGEIREAPFSTRRCPDLSILSSPPMPVPTEIRSDRDQCVQDRCQRLPKPSWSSHGKLREAFRTLDRLPILEIKRRVKANYFPGDFAWIFASVEGRESAYAADAIHGVAPEFSGRLDRWEPRCRCR